jgi:hypothetical protein
MGGLMRLESSAAAAGACINLMLTARNISEIQFVNGLKAGQLTAALAGEPVGTIIYNAEIRRGHVA